MVTRPFWMVDFVRAHPGGINSPRGRYLMHGRMVSDISPVLLVVIRVMGPSIMRMT